MYEKMLHGRRILYFRYAPPVTNLDDISARETRPNDENDPGYMWSVYYYWWAFLRLSKAYKECCENGGTGDGAPGTRDYYPADFYVAYARAPDGHKLAFVFHRYDPAKDAA